MNKFTNTLYWKISGLFVFILAILATIYFVVFIQISRKYFDETTQKLNKNVAAQMLLEVNPFKDGKINEESLGKIMHSMMAVNPNLEVYILDPTGNILSFVVLDKKVKLTSVDINPIKKFIKNGVLTYGDNPRVKGGSVIFSASEVKEKNLLVGYIYMTLNSERNSTISASLQNSYMLSLTSKYFFITLLSAILISLLLLWILIKRLSKIIEMIKKFKEGDTSARIKNIGKGELSSMALVINNMADTIVKNIQGLKEVDSLRRELIANISHDLRTPVSVIHGYAETLVIKADTIDKFTQQEYLNTIIKTSEKLKILMADLFELSKLEARQINPKPQAFFLFDILEELSNKFKLLSKEKQLTFYEEYSKDAPLVYADVAMMERVLQNLVENAIKYTPENGEVSLIIRQIQNNLEVIVANTGPGIPENEISKIFSRYYKTDNGKSNNGTGLGLAIVKNILDIHNIPIQVNSTVNKHTTFSFCLPFYKKQGDFSSN